MRALVERLEHRLILSVTPALTATFESFSSHDAGMGDPPDCSAAVGPEHVVSVVNSNIAIYAKDGTAIFTGPLDAFFAVDTAHTKDANHPDGVVHHVFDPRIVYDAQSARFVVSAADEFYPAANDTEYQVLLAVSNDADPTDGTTNVRGTWNLETISSREAV